MKRSFSLGATRAVLVVAGTGLIAATYGLIRLAYGLLLPDVRAELGLDLQVAGTVSGGASIVYCVGALAGFLLAARHARALVVAALVTGAVGAAGMAAAPSAVVFAIAAVASSAGAGLASPALVAFLQRDLEERSLARAQAVVNAGTGPGLAIAGMLALVVLPEWRAAWWVAAAVTVAVAVLVLLADRRLTRRAATPSSAPSAASAPSARAAPLLPPLSWFAAHRVVIAAALLMGFGSAAVWTYTRTVLVEAGAGETVSIVAWVALGLGGSFVIVSSRWTDRFSPRLLWTVTAGLIAIASAVVGLGGGVPALVLAGCVVFGWAYTAGSGALIGWTARIDGDRAATGTALLFVVLILGQAGGAVAAGALVTVGGYATAFLVAAATSAVAGAVALAAGRERARVESSPV